MLYRNVINGAEIESKSEISAPNWIKVGAEVLPKETLEVKEEKAETKKAASKKSTKRTKK